MNSAPEIRCLDAIFKSEKQNSKMGKLILSENDFLKAFGNCNYDTSKKYLKARELSKIISNNSEIARRIKHPNRTVHDWLSGKKIPNPIKHLDFLRAINLMPLKPSNDSGFLFFTEIVGFLFGDGHLMKHLGAFCLCGQKEDLLALQASIEKTFAIKTKLKNTRQTSTINKLIKGKIVSKSLSSSTWYLQVNSTPLARLFYLSGVPKGDKVLQKTLVPSWIMDGEWEVKQAFLSSLFGNELQCPKLRLSCKNAFSSPQLGFHKVEGNEGDLKIFLYQIKILLEEFGINSSEISLDNSYKSVRKDGLFAQKQYFSIDSNAKNILNLYTKVPFKYADEKKSRFDQAVSKFLKNKDVYKQDWEIYEKVMQMHSNGLGRRTIFKTLNLPKKYFYKINAWIHYGHKPLYYSLNQ